MAAWIKKLDEFLVLNEKQILRDAGTVSHKDMEKKVRDELKKHNEGNRQLKNVDDERLNLPDKKPED
jgi:hypothetical protein